MAFRDFVEKTIYKDIIPDDGIVKIDSRLFWEMMEKSFYAGYGEGADDIEGKYAFERMRKK